MTALTGKFSTSDTYMEVVAPIVSPDMNIPFLEEALSGAYREMDHSVSGEDNVDSLSLVVRVNSALALRVNQQNTVRSPAIGEAFQPQFISSYIIDDPCDRSNVNSGPARGKTEQLTVQQLELFSHLHQPAETASIFTYRGGNPNLLTEKSDSLNVGVVTPNKSSVYCS